MNVIILVSSLEKTLLEQKRFMNHFKELVLKLEQSTPLAAFLDLNITVGNGKISTKLYDKCDDFFIVRMSKFRSNIPSSVFYGTVISMILRITKLSFSIIYVFMKKSSALITRTEEQGRNREKFIK